LGRIELGGQLPRLPRSGSSPLWVPCSDGEIHPMILRYGDQKGGGADRIESDPGRRSPRRSADAASAAGRRRNYAAGQRHTGRGRAGAADRRDRAGYRRQSRRTRATSSRSTRGWRPLRRKSRRVGDAAGSTMFTHVAHNDARVAKSAILDGDRTTPSRLVPYMVFIASRRHSRASKDGRRAQPPVRQHIGSGKLWTSIRPRPQSCLSTRKTMC